MLAGSPPGAVPFYAAFESTYLPLHDVDVAEIAGHDTTWRRDLHAVLSAGVRNFRYPLRWHRIERAPGFYDWSEADQVLEHFHNHGAHVVIDLVHHTSYPQWIDHGFADARFGPALEAFASQVAHRYPHIESYTIFNEPLATLLLSGREGLWPPYLRGITGFVRLLRIILPAISSTFSVLRSQLPTAQHFWIDTAEHHQGTPSQAAYVAECLDRRHVVMDLALKPELDHSRPFLQKLLQAGGASLLDVPAIEIDAIGLDYYSHSEWFYDDIRGHAPSPHPVGFAHTAQQYFQRYRRPMLLSETNIRGLPTDRITWLKHMLEQYQEAVSNGIPLHGFCWFPYIDSCDWDSLLARPNGHVDPVGVVSLTREHGRARTVFTTQWERAAHGATDIPAYPFQEPCASQLQGYRRFMNHWTWQTPPVEQRIAPNRVTDAVRSTQQRKDTRMTRDLVVISHLRWDSVWQRPQHLVSRFAAMRSPSRTVFVEEPAAAQVHKPELVITEHGPITAIKLLVPPHSSHPEHHYALPFDAEGAQTYGALLREALELDAVDVLLYTPMGLEIAQDLSPQSLFYDVMDDLASFKNAPRGLVLHQQRLLQLADVVFTGGRSLHQGILRQRSRQVHLFPSGVETAHYRRSRALRVRRARKVAGYVGVIDERMDMELIAGLAQDLSDWTIRLVGPLAKIGESDLPRANNIEYPGKVSYEQLPEVMAGFDVALMPFAMNEATRSISPTKTLEYLAAGLPVVSTRVPDVVADYSDIVHLADDASQFAAACRHVVQHSLADRDARAADITERQEWEFIAHSMASLMQPSVIDLRTPARVATGGVIA